MTRLINHNRFQHQYHFNHSGSVQHYMLGQAAGCASFSEKAKIGKGNCFIFESERAAVESNLCNIGASFQYSRCVFSPTVSLSALP